MSLLQLIIILAIVSGAIWVIDQLALKKNREQLQQASGQAVKPPFYIEIAANVFPLSLLFIVLLIIRDMNIDLLMVFVGAALISGLIWLVDSLFFKKLRSRPEISSKEATLPLLVDISKALFPILIIVLIIRAFIFQLFFVPSGSLEPTVVPGDWVAVNMFEYGVRFPLFYKTLLTISKPKRGDIMLFRWPVNTNVDFIKRVVGLPGDHISYINKVFYINGKEAKQTFVSDETDNDGPGSSSWSVKKMEEDLAGVKHYIYLDPAKHDTDFYNLVVPPHHYFMIGDNRDNSDDSRYWGFVAEDDIIGKGFSIWFSWDSSAFRPRWHRIGKSLS